MLIPKKLIFIDIETVPEVQIFETLKETDNEKYRLFVEKVEYYNSNIPKKVDHKTNQYWWEDKAALMPEYSKIICISVGFEHEEKLRVKTFKGDEKSILIEFAEFLKHPSMKNRILCGQNIKNFDIPYMKKKFYSYGFLPPAHFPAPKAKPWEINVEELLDYFSSGFGVRDNRLSAICHLMGVPSPKNNMDGKYVFTLYYGIAGAGGMEFTKRYELICEYCEGDITAVYNVVVALSKLREI